MCGVVRDNFEHVYRIVMFSLSLSLKLAQQI